MKALEAIEAALNDTAPRSKLAELTSKFYTIIPHNFGRRVPPVIGDHETLQKKFDMLLVGLCVPESLRWIGRVPMGQKKTFQPTSPSSQG